MACLRYNRGECQLSPKERLKAQCLEEKRTKEDGVWTEVRGPGSVVRGANRAGHSNGEPQTESMYNIGIANAQHWSHCSAYNFPIGKQQRRLPEVSKLDSNGNQGEKTAEAWPVAWVPVSLTRVRVLAGSQGRRNGGTEAFLKATPAVKHLPWISFNPCFCPVRSVLLSYFTGGNTEAPRRQHGAK